MPLPIQRLMAKPFVGILIVLRGAALKIVVLGKIATVR